VFDANHYLIRTEVWGKIMLHSFVQADRLIVVRLNGGLLLPGEAATGGLALPLKSVQFGPTVDSSEFKLSRSLKLRLEEGSHKLFSYSLN
jgi:hypothetical protein